MKFWITIPSLTLGAFEVFEIAEQIERNGVRFYRSAARLFDDPQIHGLFNNLAAWEAEHESIFARMKNALSEQQRQPVVLDPRATISDPRAMAALAVFGLRPEPSAELTGNENRTAVLRSALEREKDSIIFYTGLKEFVAAHTDKATIDKIITEEMRHITILSQSLNDLA